MVKVKQSVRPESNVKLINNIAVGLGGLPKNSVGLLPLVETVNLPEAAKLPDGVLVIDITENRLKFVKDGEWVSI
jgi:hypothetical protein